MNGKCRETMNRSAAQSRCNGWPLFCKDVLWYFLLAAGQHLEALQVAVSFHPHEGFPCLLHCPFTHMKVSPACGC